MNAHTRFTRYSTNIEVTIDTSPGGAWVVLDAEWSFTVTPGYSGSYYQPPEKPGIEDLTLVLTLDGEKVACPDWLAERIRPTDATLMEAATEQAQYAADEAADYRREMQWESRS